jgi:hypothetical protein
MLSFVFLHCFPFSSCHGSSIINLVFFPPLFLVFFFFFLVRFRVSLAKHFISDCLYHCVYLFFHSPFSFPVVVLATVNVLKIFKVKECHESFSHLSHRERDNQISESIIILFLKAQLSKMCS